MSTNVLVHISKEVTFKGQVLQIEEFATDAYVYTQTSGNDLFYSKATGRLYTVDSTNKVLKAVDLQPQISQIQQLKGLLSDLSVNTEDEGSKKRHAIMGKGNTVTVYGEVVSGSQEVLAGTIYAEAQAYLNQTSLVDLSLQADELVELTNITINMQGNTMTNKVQVKTVEQMEESVNRFDYLLEYAIQN